MAVDFPQSASKAMLIICIDLLKAHLKMLRKGNKSKTVPNEEQQRRKQHPTKNDKGENSTPDT